jgi:hypothetical protein
VIDAEVLRILTLVESGEVRWWTKGAGIRFQHGRPHIIVADDTGPRFADNSESFAVPELHKIAERLYVRHGFEDHESGAVGLSLEGVRRLRELRGEPPKKSVWSNA